MELLPHTHNYFKKVWEALTDATAWLPQGVQTSVLRRLMVDSYSGMWIPSWLWNNGAALHPRLPVQPTCVLSLSPVLFMVFIESQGPEMQPKSAVRFKSNLIVSPGIN